MKKLLGIIIIIVLAFFTYIRLSKPRFTLPSPTGACSVGKMQLHLVDPQRYETHSGNKTELRSLLLDVWYPAASTENSEYSLLFNSVILSTIKEDISTIISTLSHQDVSVATFDYFASIKSFSHADVPLKRELAPCPVIIFSPGLGSPVVMYSALLEDLTSHGYYDNTMAEIATT